MPFIPVDPWFETFCSSYSSELIGIDYLVLAVREAGREQQAGREQRAGRHEQIFRTVIPISSFLISHFSFLRTGFTSTPHICTNRAAVDMTSMGLVQACPIMYLHYTLLWNTCMLEHNDILWCWFESTIQRQLYKSTHGTHKVHYCRGTHRVHSGTPAPLVGSGVQ